MTDQNANEAIYGKDVTPTNIPLEPVGDGEPTHFYGERDQILLEAGRPDCFAIVSWCFQ